MPSSSGDAPFRRAAALFFLSGAGALVVEITWLRWFRLWLGATAPAASATLVAFFAGQVLGAVLGARRAPSWRRPLLAYAGLEVVGALFAAGVPLALAILGGALDPVYDGLRERPAALVAVRFAVALGAALPAATAFGATLPTLASAVLPGADRLGSRGATLYGLNTLGAAAGAALASFWLPDALGVPGAYAAGLGALLAAAAGAAALACGRPAREPARLAAPARPEAASRAPGSLAGFAALSGFGAFACQVLLVQAFGLVLDQSTYAFGVVLVVVLVGLAAGALGVGALDAAGRARPQALLGGALGLAGLGLAAFPALFVAATGGLAPLASERPWPAYLGRALALAAGLAGPALLAAAAVFPALLGVAARAPGAGDPGARLGRLVAANTVGALAGALAAPYLLLPALGLWGSFAALGGLYALGALAAAGPGPRALRAAVLGAAAVGLALRAAPASLPALRTAPGERVVDLASTPSGLVAVLERDGQRRIQVDNHYALGGTADRVHQERQGHVPLLLHPGARRVAFLGSATGSSASAALAHPAERITLVELVPGVARAAARFFAGETGGIHASSRAEIVLDDARNFVRATRARFDVVVGDLFVPWRAGAGSLFTREHFRAVRAHLTADGVFCQWLPLYQIGAAEFEVVAATFLDVFPESALFRGDFYGRFPIVALVGFAGAPPEPAAVSAAAAALAERGVADRWVADPAGVWSLYVGPLAPLARALADTPRNTDARPVVEFRAARGRAAGATFVGLEWSAFAGQLRTWLSTHEDPLFPALPAGARRAAEAGHALQRAGALYVAGRRGEAARTFARAREDLPARLVADAAPDPTAAEVWGP